MPATRVPPVSASALPDTSPGREAMLPGMRDMLSQIDRMVDDARTSSLLALMPAMSRGVRVVSNPLVRDGDIVISVSPRDYKLLKEFAK